MDTKDLRDFIEGKFEAVNTKLDDTRKIVDRVARIVESGDELGRGSLLERVMRTELAIKEFREQRSMSKQRNVASYGAAIAGGLALIGEGLHLYFGK